MDATRCCKTNDTDRGRRSRVVLTPRRWRQVATMLAHCAYDGGKKARSPGRARRKPLKPLRRECRNDFGEPVATTLVCFFHFARGAMGAAGTRHSLRPLFHGRSVRASLGRFASREREVVSTSIVVPANAGTHTPCWVFWETLFDGFWATTNACGYGSLRSQGRQ
jgi:hypothetical protein